MSEAEFKLRIALRAAEKSKISRRDFIQLASLAGLTFGTANTMFSQALRAQPKRGGAFKTGMGHGEKVALLIQRLGRTISWLTWQWEYSVPS